ncbi:uncharacterized protein LOC132702367 [Cylas formicarius]|uniref:uncharacterized protein LOC132702367 n=1 Tax=Cylas formicarius TaxID=197179 RepID=UPI002958A77E|nr:uncharacterized protein LOC132702367 [Cylas formicarius]
MTSDSTPGLAKGSRSQLLVAAILVVALRTVSSAPSSELDLLLNPCYNHVVRHHRSPADKQLNNLNQILRTLNLTKLYPKSLKRVSGNCPKLNRMMQPLRKASDLKTAHQRFYHSMIEFYFFLNQLRDLPIKTNVNFDFEKRRSFFDQTKNSLRLTICEFNETMMHDHGVAVQTLTKAPRLNTKCLPQTADLSRAQMLDVQFFKKIRKFFKQSKVILKMLKRKKKSRSKKRKTATR